jgi:Ca2+-binding EF-hand superfamily protein
MTPAASPAATAPSGPKAFAELDANRDGRLSRDEVAGDATWSADFDAADLDHNGFISKAEFDKHAAAARKSRDGKHRR